MIKSKEETLNDCLQYILANSFDVHIVEQKAKEALSILSQFPSQGLREEEKSKVKDLIRDAWGASALAHRLYPENKHTFSDYWHTLDKKEFESLFTSTINYEKERT